MLDLSREPEETLPLKLKAEELAIWEETKRQTLDQWPSDELVQTYEKSAWTFLYYIADFHLRHLTAIRAAMERKRSGAEICKQLC